MKNTNLTTCPQLKTSFWNEEWKEIVFPKGALRKRYAISNYGRVVSFSDSFENARIVKGGTLKGYKTLPLRPFGKSTTFYVHKLVAEYFLPKPEEGQQFVLHLDYNKTNNFVSNLKWANRKETLAHQQHNPTVLDARQKVKERIPVEGPKLTMTQVMRLKKKLLDPDRKTKLRIIAKQFGVSEMQLHRIRRGENWGHVQVHFNDNVDGL
ncbi:NUMOD4 domain-containing protein [Alkalitalea saponilacus]|uniref:HNH endonuclease n=1 Tax=Alkalitalea saponilacus TaxID=889453 RepID=A0A1T5AMR9_9BACT|nr:NUMOD4 domain-containing protein [Alkalitalea saponilacus]SKB36175.1 HNH endonuclease [Alkalitalea saponilacus]